MPRWPSRRREPEPSEPAGSEIPAPAPARLTIHPCMRGMPLNASSAAAILAAVDQVDDTGEADQAMSNYLLSTHSPAELADLAVSALRQLSPPAAEGPGSS